MNPTVAADDPINNITSLIASNDHRAAWVQIIELLESEPTGATCQALADVAVKLDAQAADLVPIRVALLANFTADLIAPVLVARALQSRLLVEPFVANYDTWVQEILDPSSSLHEWNPDVIVLALQLEALSPALTSGFLELTPEQATAEISAVVERIESAVAVLRSWCSAKLLFHEFPVPDLSALGILDPRLPNGQTATVRRLNERLASLAEREADIYLVDIPRLIGRVGVPRWHDARLWRIAKIPFTQVAIHTLADEYIHYLRAFKGLTRKVLVVDLDDTLWGGTLGEDGPDGIRLGGQYPGNAFTDVQRAILTLHRRGVILAINSKNNAEETLELIEKHPDMVLRPEHFAAIRINWQDKSANMLEIASELGLSLDSFVFIDDNAVECERVRRSLPEVLTVHLAAEPATRPGSILGLGVFDTLSYSQEDRRRGALYQQEGQRARERSNAQSLEEFYWSLKMELAIEEVGPAQLQRAAELTQRTNQFNLTTRRYTVDALRKALLSPGCEAYVFRLTDKFGDNGIIGLAILEGVGARLCISTLLMSCRVLRRTVEDAILAFLFARARERGATAIEGQYRPTLKNGQTGGFYPGHGFEPVGPDGDVQRFLRDVNTPIESPRWIVVGRQAAVREA